MLRTALRFALCATPLLVLAACGDDEPPPPSTPPAMSQAAIACGPATGGPYPYTYDAIERVEVRIEDAERDLVDGSIRGEVGGYPMRALADDDADGVYVWTPPAGLGPLVCRGPIPVRIEATDLDGNRSELDEVLEK